MPEIPKVATTSENISNVNLEKLRSVFPSFVKDGQIDFDALQAFLKSEGTLAGEEKYGLSWAGKSDAFRAIRTPATGTLTPQPAESKNWDTTQNIFIEWDNLEVLKLLQKHYRGEIKMIYIDPPYNTGKDFVYKDNFTKWVADYYEQTGQTKDGIRMTANTEKNGRYHSDWLTMMYPRLFLAHNLLREDGVIFVSIDDNEVANLRMIMDEIFGEENFVAQFVWSGWRKNDSKLVSVSHEYTLCYVKNLDHLKQNNIIWRQRKKGLELIYKAYDHLKKKYKDDYKKIEQDLSDWFASLPNTNPAKKQSHYSKVDKRWIYFPDNISWPGGGGPKYEVLHPLTKKPVAIPSRGWMFGDIKRMQEIINENRVHFGIDETYVPCIKSYLIDREHQAPYSIFYQDGRASTKRLRELMGGDIFDHPKDELVLKDFVEFSTKINEDDIILDFFAGSGTTAHAVMDLNAEDGGNRRFICVQLPEMTSEESEAYKARYKKISDITRERIRRAGDKITASRHPAVPPSFQPSPTKEDARWNPSLDIGLKSFVLESSNYRQWNTLTDSDDAETLKAQMKLFAEKPLADNAEENSIVYEILLKEGFDLNAKVIKTDTKNKKRVFIVEDMNRRLFISLAESFSGEEVAELTLWNADTFVCFDSALDDTTKVNLARNFTIKVI